MVRLTHSTIREDRTSNEEAVTKIEEPIVEDSPWYGMLKPLMRGTIIQRIDKEYDISRKVFNGMIDKHPHLIVYCYDVADVITAVNFARENNLLTAVRSGGHNGGGLSICDDGIVIDLSRTKGIRVDPLKRTARVEGGALWRDVDHATHAFGLATPGGYFSSTGVAGLTLGGGLGYLNRKHGLVIDNLLEVDVVLANGTFVTANEKEHSDLFWAVRGGGGNFGIVTSFLFKLHPVKNIFGGPTFWPVEQAPEVLRWWREFMTTTREDFSGFFGIMAVPPAPHFPAELHLREVCGIVWCYSGPEEEATEAFAPVLKIGTPLLHGVQKMPYPALQSAFDAVYPPGLQAYWKADVIDELTDEMIDQFMKNVDLPSPLSTIHIYPLTGATQRVESNATPWQFRKAKYSITILGIDSDVNKNDSLRQWTRDYYDLIHPFSSGGAYLNMTMDTEPDRVRESFGPNYERLANIKAKYDPENFFRVNQNIKPSSLA